MAIVKLRVAGYRSVYDVSLPLGQLNILVGPNGCGKTNLYRGMYLLARAAAGQLSRTLAEEGGMPSALWAGARAKKERARVTLAVTLNEFTYELTCGLPAASPEERSLSAFTLDPEVKEEHIWFQHGKKRVVLLEREHSFARVRNGEGVQVDYPLELSNSESILSQLVEPHQFPELSLLCQEFLGWRFYHQFRTDPDSPLRHPQIGIRTSALAHDGRDLAAALQTILEIGDAVALNERLERAFPGAQLEIEYPQARFSLALRMPSFQRSFDARELSDGTLHYLCLLAALLSPRPPSLLALNEPETSIHPDLIEPLAELIVHASRRSQLWITTHSRHLADSIHRLCPVRPVVLEKVDGETRRTKEE